MQKESPGRAGALGPTEERLVPLDSPTISQSVKRAIKKGVEIRRNNGCCLRRIQQRHLLRELPKRAKGSHSIWLAFVSKFRTPISRCRAWEGMNPAGKGTLQHNADS